MMTMNFLRAECRSRAMVDKTTDNRSDLMVAQFVFLLLARAIFRVISTEMDVKNCQYYCKRQIGKNFPWSIRLSIIAMTSKCSKLCSETTHLWLVVPLEFCTFYDVICMVDKSADHEKLSIFLR